MSNTPFLVLGESLVDLIAETGSWRFEAAPGGSPLNVAIGLATAGHAVRLASQVGDDLFGPLLRAHLERHGVDTVDLAVTDGPTSLAFARIDRDGVAGYDFRFAWTWAGSPGLDGIACLHVGSLATVVPPGADAVAEVVAAARRQGVTVSFDPNVRPSLIGDRAAATGRIERFVTAADVVKVSAEDLAWLYPGTPDVSVAARWADLGPRLVVVTRGGAGSIAVHDGKVVTCSAPKVEVVDTVGAGDSFTAGLLSGLARAGGLTAAPAGGPPRPATAVAPDAVAAALRAAAATAAATCAHRGASPPPPGAVAALLPEAQVQPL